VVLQPRTKPRPCPPMGFQCSWRVLYAMASTLTAMVRACGRFSFVFRLSFSMGLSLRFITLGRCAANLGPSKHQCGIHPVPFGGSNSGHDGALAHCGTVHQCVDSYGLPPCLTTPLLIHFVSLLAAFDDLTIPSRLACTCGTLTASAFSKDVFIPLIRTNAWCS
jgi:hypothetical protein